MVTEDRCAVIGTTSWGIALANLCSNKLTTHVICRNVSEKENLLIIREKQIKQKGIVPSKSLQISIKEELENEYFKMLIVAVPSHAFRSNLKQNRSILNVAELIVSATKGLELNSLARMSVICSEVLDNIPEDKIGVLSGPNFSGDVNNEVPTCTVVAFKSLDNSLQIKKFLEQPKFKIITSVDVVGVELCGAIKNVYAIGSGIIHGLKLGDNFMAAYFTTCYKEVMELINKCGGKLETLNGYAGLGDLAATCYGELSRNRACGFKLAQGKSLDEIKSETEHNIEGIYSTQAFNELANRTKTQAPVLATLHKVLTGKIDTTSFPEILFSYMV